MRRIRILADDGHCGANGIPLHSKGMTASQRFIEKNSNCKNIASSIHGISSHLFGRHVLGSSNGPAMSQGSRISHGIEYFGDTKIQNFHKPDDEPEARDQKDEATGAKDSTDIIVAIVPETGASIYSASGLAREELPGLDVSLRGAVSIARRLQDPLAELVKIEPRSMGVGQYQHDLNQKSLSQELDLAVEGVVNKVGVELNTASASLLKRVSGLSDRLAKNLIEFRDSNGAFPSRKILLDVAGFGPKTFEQAAGFLKIQGQANPLDSTAVHPERYELVESMAKELNVSTGELMGNPALISKLELKRFIDHEKGIGEFTLTDIRAELEKPGRDPRPEFRVPEWREDIQTMDDLKPDLVLEGRVSNVTNFGAFVDIGVKRDGLVHLSEITHRWLKDPRDAVQVGQIVKVKVMEVNKDRERITLSMKALEAKPPVSRKSNRKTGKKKQKQVKNQQQKQRPPAKKKPDRKPQKKVSKEVQLNDLLEKFKRRW